MLKFTNVGQHNIFLILDEILHDVGSIIDVRKEENKSHLVLNKDFLDSYKEQGKDESKQKTNFILKAFNFGSSSKEVQEKSSDWLSSTKTLDDQVIWAKMF